jgi:hypothetical protein
VNVRFKTQDVLDKDLMVISLETPVHPLEISSAAEAELQILSIQLDRILYQIEEIPTTVLRKKIAQIILVLLITMGSLVLDTQPEPFIKRRWREWKFYLGLGNVKQEGVVRNSTYERTNIDFNTSYKLGENYFFKGKVSYSTSSSNRVQQGSNLVGITFRPLPHRGRL